MNLWSRYLLCEPSSLSSINGTSLERWKESIHSTFDLHACIPWQARTHARTHVVIMCNSKAQALCPEVNSGSQ